MKRVLFREATAKDIPQIAKLRSEKSEFEEYWNQRITAYLAGTHNPQKALQPRIIYVACDDEKVVGFIAGHLTKRLNCEGELEWIDVIKEYRRCGIASELVTILAKWFVKKKSCMICVDPGNEGARAFYKSIGATMLNDHWMFWEDIRSLFSSPGNQ